MPDGTSEDMPGKAGQALFTPVGKHLPENIGDKDFDAILIELKTPKAASSAAKK